MIYGNPILVGSAGGSTPVLTGWAAVQANVRAGNGPAMYPVGTEFNMTFDSTYADDTLVVVAHDTHTPVDPDLTHSMTLQFKHVISKRSDNKGCGFPYDGQAAFGIITNTLTSGVTCSFYWPKTVGAAEQGIYQLTTSNAASSAQVGHLARLVMETIKNGPLIAYSTNIGTGGSTILNSGVISKVTTPAATSLTDYLDINTSQGAIYGDVNYSIASICNWLNGSVDFAPEYNKFYSADVLWKGIYGNISSDLRPYIALVKVPYQANIEAVDNSIIQYSNQYIFDPSFYEINGESLTQTHESQLKLYETLNTVAGRTKTDIYGTARYYCLRTPYSLYQIYTINSSGNFYGDYPKAENYHAPLLVIA